MRAGRQGLRGWIEDFVWGARAAALPPWQRRALTALRAVIVLARDLAVGQLTLRAMSLVYTTLLSIVPLLALSFSVLKAFGIYNQIRPMLLNFLEPLGEKGEEVASRIVQFIERMNVGVLGAVGLALLVYTAVSLMQKIEESLNYIWRIPRPRRFGERFSRYLSVLLVGPILVFSALGITASVTNLEAVRQLLATEVLGGAVQAASRLTPYLLVIAAFTFVYLFIPNTRVRFWPALAGGIAGGIAWQTAGWAFALFVAASGKYAAIYSSLAILILFMIWVYLSWLILLFGANVAFYVQHPEYAGTGGGEPQLSARLRERLALAALSAVAARFLEGTRAPTLAGLARELGVPFHPLAGVMEALESGGLAAQSNDDPPLYLPGRDPSRITVAEVLETVRAAGEGRALSVDALPAPPQVDEVIARMRRAGEAAGGQVTLRELALARERKSAG